MLPRPPATAALRLIFSRTALTPGSTGVGGGGGAGGGGGGGGIEGGDGEKILIIVYSPMDHNHIYIEAE